MVYASGTSLDAINENGERVMQVNLGDYYRSERGVYFHKKLPILETGSASLLQSSEVNQELSDCAEESRSQHS